jgi:hypothetical protein
LPSLRCQGCFPSATSHRRNAPPLLLKAAKCLERLDQELARETYLDAWGAALFAGRLATAGSLLEVSRAARSAPPPTGPPRPSDLLLDGLATLITEGTHRGSAHAEAGGERIRRQRGHRGRQLPLGWLTTTPSTALWDDESRHAINARQLQLTVTPARSPGCRST